MTDNLVYEVTYNGSVQGPQSGTSFARSGLGEADYSITVRAINNAGAGAQSGSAGAHINRVPSPPPNATVIVASACILNETMFYKYIDDCLYQLSAGSGVLAVCRGVRNGIWWFYFHEPVGGAHRFVKATDTTLPYTGVGECG